MGEWIFFFHYSFYTLIIIIISDLLEFLIIRYAYTYLLSLGDSSISDISTFFIQGPIRFSIRAICQLGPIIDILYYIEGACPLKPFLIYPLNIGNGKPSKHDIGATGPGKTTYHGIQPMRVHGHALLPSYRRCRPLGQAVGPPFFFLLKTFPFMGDNYEYLYQ